MIFTPPGYRLSKPEVLHEVAHLVTDTDHMKGHGPEFRAALMRLHSPGNRQRLQEAFDQADLPRMAAVYHVEVSWGVRDIGGKKLTPDLIKRYVTVDAYDEQEAQLMAAQMVVGEQQSKKRDVNGEPAFRSPNPIADMPDGMVTRTRII